MFGFLRAVRLNWKVNKKGDPLVRVLHHRAVVEAARAEVYAEAQAASQAYDDAMATEDYEQAAKLHRVATDLWREWGQLRRHYDAADRVVGWHGGPTSRGYFGV